MDAKARGLALARRSLAGVRLVRSHLGASVATVLACVSIASCGTSPPTVSRSGPSGSDAATRPIASGAPPSGALGTTPATSVGPSPAPTETATATPPPKDVDETTYRLVGWIGGDVLFIAGRFTSRGVDHRLVTFDVDRTAWVAGPPLATDPGDAVSDGRTALISEVPEDDRDPVAVLVRDDRTLQPIVLPNDAWVRDWTFWGGLAARPGGGYVLTGTSMLATVTSDGRLDVAPLPEGHIVHAATSDPNGFLLGRLRGDSGAEDRDMSVTGLVLWDRVSDALQAITDDPVAVEPARDGLAWIRRADGSWHLLTVGGLQPAVASARRESWIDASGRYLAVVAGAGEPGCPEAPVGACRMALLDAESGGQVAVLPGPAAGRVFWSGRTLAYATGALREPGRAPPELVIAEGERVARFPFP